MGLFHVSRVVSSNVNNAIRQQEKDLTAKRKEKCE